MNTEHLYMNKMNPKSVQTLCTISEKLFPSECPEFIREHLKTHVATFNDNPAGRISYLKKRGLTESLGNWRDQFVKDMYLSTLRGYTVVKKNHPEKFILHKLEVLRDLWPKLRGFEDFREDRGILNQVLQRLYRIFPEKKRKELWDWRLAYQRENPDTESIDPAILDRVEREFPNFMDKIRIKPELWERDFADSRAKTRPNYTTEEEYNDPKLWEGAVIGVRSPEDMMIKVTMFRIFERDPDEDDDDELLPKQIDVPMHYVEGLGHGWTYEEDRQVNGFLLDDPYFNIYGKPVWSLPRED